MEDVDSGDRLMGWTAVLSDKHVCVRYGWIRASFSFDNNKGQVCVKKQIKPVFLLKLTKLLQIDSGD